MGGKKAPCKTDTCLEGKSLKGADSFLVCTRNKGKCFVKTFNVERGIWNNEGHSSNTACSR